jgi:hypothetical protein
MARTLCISLILTIYPLSNNAFIFSAEGDFFDRLVLFPSFPYFLKSRYLEYVLFSSTLFVILLCALKSRPELYYDLFAIYFYCVGVIIPVSFLSVFFANHKYIISSISKTWTDQPKIQSLSVIIIYVVLLMPVLLIYYISSSMLAGCFMFLGGLAVGLFSQHGIALLYKYYKKHRQYRHIENYKK